MDPGLRAGQRWRAGREGPPQAGQALKQPLQDSRKFHWEWKSSGGQPQQGPSLDGFIPVPPRELLRAPLLEGVEPPRPVNNNFKDKAV